MMTRLSVAASEGVNGPCPSRRLGYPRRSGSRSLELLMMRRQRHVPGGQGRDRGGWEGVTEVAPRGGGGKRPNPTKVPRKEARPHGWCHALNPSKTGTCRAVHSKECTGRLRGHEGVTTRICSGLGHTDGVPSPAAVTSGRLQYAPTGHTAGSPLARVTSSSRSTKLPKS